MRIFKVLSALSFLCICLTFSSCEEKNIYEDLPRGELKLDLSNITFEKVKGGRVTEVAIEDFVVEVYSVDREIPIITFPRFGDITDPIMLTEGDYYVKAYSDNFAPAAFDNPVYSGTSEVFTITSGKEETVEIVCSLVVVKINVDYTENVLSSFEDWSTTVSNDGGSLNFTKGETRSGYFAPGDINISTELFYSLGGITHSITLEGELSGTLANEEYNVTIDAIQSNGIIGGLSVTKNGETVKKDFTLSNIDLGKGLIAYYPFTGGSIADASGNNHNSVVNTAVLTADRNGVTNNAYQFDDASGFIRIPHHPDLNLSNGDYSVSSWIKHNGYLEEGTILSKREGCEEQGWALHVHGENNTTAGVEAGQMIFNLSGCGGPSVTAQEPNAVGAWYHVAVVYTSSEEKLDIYINGILSSTATNISKPNNSITSDLYIGADEWTLGWTDDFYFDGAIDEIRIYGRSLHKAEIDKLSRM